jgi:hypothetical protein
MLPVCMNKCHIASCLDNSQIYETIDCREFSDNPFQHCLSANCDSFLVSEFYAEPIIVIVIIM